MQSLSLITYPQASARRQVPVTREIDRVRFTNEIGIKLEVPLRSGPGLDLAVVCEAGPRGPIRRVRVENQRFVHTDGTPFEYQGLTGFSLLRRLIDGQDISDFLQYARDLGVWIVRVFASHYYIQPALLPHLVPNYFDHVHALLETAAKFGLHVQLDAAQDFQIIGLAQDSQFIPQLAREVAQHANGWFSIGNEPYKNGVDPFQFNEFPPELMTTRGAAQEVPGAFFPPLRYSVYHHRRMDKDGAGWEDLAPELAYPYHGFTYYVGQESVRFPGVHQPIVGEEPMGADETIVPGHRDTNPEKFYRFSRALSAYWKGCYHFTRGIQGLPPLLGTAQWDCGQAFAEGWS